MKTLVDGFYWVKDVIGRPFVALRDSTHGRVHWYLPGSVDYYFSSDDDIDVIAGPLTPPEADQ
jgi:hypothetical protein